MTTKRLDKVQEEKPLHMIGDSGIPLEFIIIAIIMIIVFIIILFFGFGTESGIWFNGELA